MKNNTLFKIFLIIACISTNTSFIKASENSNNNSSNSPLNRSKKLWEDHLRKNAEDPDETKWDNIEWKKDERVKGNNININKSDLPLFFNKSDLGPHFSMSNNNNQNCSLNSYDSSSDDDFGYDEKNAEKVFETEYDFANFDNKENILPTANLLDSREHIEVHNNNVATFENKWKNHVDQVSPKVNQKNQINNNNAAIQNPISVIDPNKNNCNNSNINTNSNTIFMGEHGSFIKMQNNNNNSTAISATNNNNSNYGQVSEDQVTILENQLDESKKKYACLALSKSLETFKQELNEKYKSPLDSKPLTLKEALNTSEGEVFVAQKVFNRIVEFADQIINNNFEKHTMQKQAIQNFSDSNLLVENVDQLDDNDKVILQDLCFYLRNNLEDSNIHNLLSPLIYTKLFDLLIQKCFNIVLPPLTAYRLSNIKTPLTQLLLVDPTLFENTLAKLFAKDQSKRFEEALLLKKICSNPAFHTPILLGAMAHELSKEGYSLYSTQNEKLDLENDLLALQFTIFGINKIKECEKRDDAEAIVYHFNNFTRDLLQFDASKKVEKKLKECIQNRNWTSITQNNSAPNTVESVMKNARKKKEAHCILS